jgi:hypothetical protein
MPFFLTEHFWAFFFGMPGGPHFYEAAVWGNVVAVLPLAVLALFGWFWHKGAVEEMHRKLDAAAARADVHAEHMKKVLDLLNPETDGGIADVLDRLDPVSPGGLQVVVDRIETLGKSVADLHGRLDDAALDQKPKPQRSGRAPSE